MDYYITAGAFATYALNFEDEEAPMWERVWLNFHEYRLINLQVQKMSHEELYQIMMKHCFGKKLKTLKVLVTITWLQH